MRVLITNNSLANRAGTELYVRDVATGLIDRGYEVTAYSTELGDVARELIAAGVTVTTDLGLAAGRFDIIHGQHHLETMTALLNLPATPAVYFCHGSTPWQEAAPRFPRLLRYVAVDDACRDRLILEHSIPPDRIRLILNFVDLQRFPERLELPVRPKRALIFSNQAAEHTYVSAIRQACRQAGIALDVIGYSAGKVCSRPESVLGEYDLVFAKGRAALEALAVGAAVIVCDAAGAGPMVTTENVEQLRPLNFGLRVLQDPVSADIIGREIKRYHASDARRVSEFIRRTASREGALDELLSLYREVIDEHKLMPTSDWATEHEAAAAYLRELKPRLQSIEILKDQAIATLKRKEQELEMIKGSRTWRAIGRYSRVKRNLFKPGRWFTTDQLPEVPAPGCSATFQEKPLTIESTFRRIYHGQEWGNGESVSGPGSTVMRTAAFAPELVNLLTEIESNSLLDAGCGDLNWMKELDLGPMSFIGVDVVPELISRNQQLYRTDSRDFLKLDMTRDHLPKVDVILCRDSLVHLSYKDILAALENFKRSGSTYLIATTFTRWPANLDIKTGEWRALNLELPPFSFPKPLRVIDEKCDYANGVFADKCLALWALKDLPLT
ncbi:MAG: hypothetical protein QOK48_398 [Blastocatellia bacterium]|nr:hypothetical protein [Blastocatellia bacterium]